MRWRKDMARVSSWAGTPGKPVRAGTAEAQLHLRSRCCWLFQGGLGAVPGWKPGWKVMPGSGSCPSPELGLGTLDPRFVALSPEIPSSIPGLGCLEPAPPAPSPAPQQHSHLPQHEGLSPPP